MFWSTEVDVDHRSPCTDLPWSQAVSHSGIYSEQLNLSYIHKYKIFWKDRKIIKFPFVPYLWTTPGKLIRDKIRQCKSFGECQQVYGHGIAGEKGCSIVRPRHIDCISKGEPIHRIIKLFQMYLYQHERMKSWVGDGITNTGDRILVNTTHSYNRNCKSRMERLIGEY